MQKIKLTAPLLIALGFCAVLFLGIAGLDQAHKSDDRPNNAALKAPLQTPPENRVDDRQTITESVKLFKGNVYIKSKSPLTLSFNFDTKVINDKEQIFLVKTTPEALPFTLSKDVPLKYSWVNDRELQLTFSDNKALIPELEKSPLVLTWKKDFKTYNNKLFSYVGHKSSDPKADFSTTPIYLKNSYDKKSGHSNQTEILVAPYTVKASVSRAGNDVIFNFTFNRPLSAAASAKEKLALEDLPFTLSPALDMEGKWLSSNTLVATAKFDQDSFWEKITDQQFRMEWNNSFQSSYGVPNFDNAEIIRVPFYIERFRLLSFPQSKMDVDGNAYFDLIFNKPVNLEEVKKKVSFFKFDGTKYTIPANFEVTEVGGPGDSHGVIAHIKVKGQNGDKLQLTVKDMVSKDGRGLIRDYGKTVTVNNFFNIYNTDQGYEARYPWKTYFSLQARENIIFDEIENFIKFDPPQKYTIADRSGSTIKIYSDFSAAEPTRVTFLKGLPTEKGLLDEDLTYEIQMDGSAERKLMFTGRGRYLSPNKPLLVKVAGRNVARVRLQAWRIYENNLPAIINVQDYDASVRVRLAQQFSKNILEKESDIDGPEGEVFERLLDLKQAFKKQPNGAYLLKISPLNKKARDGDNSSDENEYADNRYSSYYDYSDYYYNTERYLPVMVSDLGIAAHVLPQRVTVWVNSLSAAEPVGNAHVKFYDSANQVLVEGKTDKDGLFSTEQKIMNQSVFVTVEKGDDLNYMTLGNDARRAYDDYEDNYYDEGWETNNSAKWYGGDTGYVNVHVDQPYGSRDYLTRGYEAFVFMPRDIFKPGETIAVKAIVRDRDIMPPSKTFPLMWKVHSPDGRVLSQGTSQMNKNGGLDFNSELPFSAPTGLYSVTISLPEASASIGGTSFTVEDFVPPRLDIKIKPENIIYTGAVPEIKLNADVQYLFGAPGDGLSWELDTSIARESLYISGWSSFYFPDFNTKFETIRTRLADSGKLDENGRQSIAYKPEIGSYDLPNKLRINFSFSVQEDGGRWNSKKTSVLYYPYNSVLGVKVPARVLAKESAVFAVAALTPQGQASDVSKLEVEFFQVLPRYYNSYKYGRAYRQVSEELLPRFKQELILAENGSAELSFAPDAAGNYEIWISDKKNGRSIKKRFSAAGLIAAEEETIAKGVVELNLDKSSYKPGETATLKIKSPFEGRLWLTMENIDQLYSLSRPIDATETELRLEVPHSVKNNVYITATVIRPVAEGQTEFRAIGVKSLEIDRELNRLHLDLNMPGHIAPSEKTKLKISFKDNNGKPVAGEATVAFVDEGILSLTGFKTPDPWGMFTVSRIFRTLFYDLYEQLLPIESETVPFLLPGGGDGMGRDGLFSPYKRKQELLSLFIATVEIGPNGQGEVELDIPEYSGQGRLMVVASSRDRFGSAQKSVLISRDLTVEATLPLALAPGDRFQIPVRVFLAESAKAEAGKAARFSITTEGPISLQGQPQASFNLAPGDGQSFFFQAAAIPEDRNSEQAGVGKLIIKSSDGMGRAFSQTVETVVRPPYPRVTSSHSLKASEAETQIQVPADGYLKGTAEATVVLSSSPAIEAARAIKYLSEYPYGCLEQTISRAWIFVAADDFLDSMDPEANKMGHIEKGLNAAVKRLATMRTTSGGFAYWPGQEDVYEWGTVYATHFLTMAERKTKLPSGLKESALAWLRSYLGANYSSSHDSAEYILSTRAYAVYILALNGEYKASWVNALKDHDNGLSPSARIFIAAAESLHKGNSDPLKKLEADSSLDMSYNTLSRRYSSLDSPARNTALKLAAWSEIDPLSPVTSALAEKVAEQGRNNYWSNTQENGMAVLALGSYLTKSGVGRAYEATLTSADGHVLFKANQRKLGAAGVKALKNKIDKPLNLLIEGEGRPYYTLTVAGVPQQAPEPAGNGLKIKRSWILPDGSERMLSSAEETARPVEIKKGDRILVKLEITADEQLQNMIVLDLLPGAFEIENSKLGAGQDGDNVGSHRMEIREDRLVIIEPWVYNGTHSYVYSMRAVSSGEFMLPPTLAEGMYEPQKQAVISGGKVLVRDK